MATPGAALMFMPNEVLEKIMKHLLASDSFFSFFNLRLTHPRLKDLVDVMVRMDESVAKAIIIGAVPEYAAVSLWEEWARQGWGHDNCKRLVEFLSINSPASKENCFTMHKFRYSLEQVVETLTPFSKISVVRTNGNLMLVGFVCGAIRILLRDSETNQLILDTNQDDNQGFSTSVKDILQTSVDMPQELLDLKVFFAISVGGVRMYALSSTGHEQQQQQLITSCELRIEDLRSASACNGVIVVFTRSGIFIWDQINEAKVVKDGTDVLVTGYAFWNVRTARLCISTLSFDVLNNARLSLFHLSEEEDRLVLDAEAAIGLDKTSVETSRLVKFICDQVIGLVSADGHLVICSCSFSPKQYNTMVPLGGVITAIALRFNVLFLGTSAGRVFAYKLRSHMAMSELQLADFDWSSGGGGCSGSSCAAVTSIDFQFCDEEATVIFSTSEEVVVCDWNFQ